MRFLAGLFAGLWVGALISRPRPSASQEAAEEVADGLGWWAIPGENLLDMLRRAHSGENPDLIYTEEWVNATREGADDG